MKTRDISPPKVPRNEAAHWCSLVVQKAPTVRFSSPVLAGGHLPSALALDAPSACLTVGLERLKLEKPFQGPNRGTPRQRFLSARQRGGWSASGLIPSRTMAAQCKPPGLPVGSLTELSASFMLSLPDVIGPTLPIFPQPVKLPSCLAASSVSYQRCCQWCVLLELLTFSIACAHFISGL